MMKLAIAIAFVAFASALPSPDTTVPEVMMTQTTSKVTLKTRLAAHQAAKDTITTMLQAGSPDDACAELATTTITEVEDAVSAQQEILNHYVENDGSACLEEGKSAVDAAQAALDEAKKDSEDKSAAAVD